MNGNHLSNDGAFIEKRRRGLARFLNALVRHPILGQEQLVIMFLDRSHGLSVWRKQLPSRSRTRFAGRPFRLGSKTPLPTLTDLFDRTRAGVRRSAELYINVCSIMDRLVKRSGGRCRADHARIALSLHLADEASAEDPTPRTRTTCRY